MTPRKRIDAPCQLDPDLWFSEKPADIAEAKAGCGTCKLFAACVKLTADLNPEFGVWAGMAPSERGQSHYRVRLTRDTIGPSDVTHAKAMRARGLTTPEAARVLGVKPGALQKAIERAA